MQLTKRKLLALGATTTIGTATLLTTSSTPTRASVKLNSLSISDKTAAVTSDVTDVVLATDFTYSFESNTAIDECVFQLRAGKTTDGLASLGGVRKPDVGTSGSGTDTIQASILNHSAIGAGWFTPPTGEQVSRQIMVELAMVLSVGGDVVKEASARAQPTITVNDETITVNAGVEGSGGATVVE